MSLNFPYLGEAIALSHAIFWAIAIIFFKKSGEKISPIALNLFKNIFGFTLLLLTLFIAGTSLFLDVPLSVYGILLLSGFMGIGVADTFFLRSLNVLGAGRAAVVECLYSPFMITLSFFFLGERLTAFQASGALLIVVAVVVATYTRHKKNLESKELAAGVFWGALSHLIMAVSLIMVKRPLEAYPLLWVTEWRMIGGLLAIFIYLAFNPNRKKVLGTLNVKGTKRYLIGGAFFGSYLMVITWLGGMKYTQASVAAVLNQTSTIFTFILATVFLHEPISMRKISAIGLALVGVLLVTFC